MKIITAALFLFSLSTQAWADEEWISYASNSDTSWEIKTGSLNFLPNRNGENIALVLGRSVHSDTSGIAFFKWYVTEDDCAKKMGSFVALSLKGDFLFQQDFVFDGGTVASILAETICLSAEAIKGKGA